MTTINEPQRSEAWFQARRGMPTCSRFDRIVMPVRGEASKGQDGLINDLIAESIMPPEEWIQSDDPFRRGTPAMEAGMRLEAEARCAYELEFAPSTVSQVGFILHESGLFGGSPDALVGDDGGVEIKCPGAATHIGYIRAGILPSEYRCQVHGYLLVTGRPWWDFFSYARHTPPFRLRVFPDDFTAKLAVEIPLFCRRYNEARAKFGLPPLGQAKEAA